MTSNSEWGILNTIGLGTCKETALSNDVTGHRKRVDAVIPVYNEEADLERSITTLREFLLANGQAWDWRIVIADNASRDRTLEIARSLTERWPGQVSVVRLEQKGRGRALRRAWTESDADVVCYMDVDLSTDLKHLPTLLTALTSGEADVAFGSRLMPESQVTRGLKREIISRSYNLIIKLFFWHHFRDAQCGFKGITRRVAEEVLPAVQDNAFFFDTELLLVAEKNGYRLREIPVRWVDDPDSRVKIVKTATEDLKGLWRLKRSFPRIAQPSMSVSKNLSI